MNITDSLHSIMNINASLCNIMYISASIYNIMYICASLCRIESKRLEELNLIIVEYQVLEVKFLLC